MDTRNWNIKYIIGNVVIVVLVVWWASLLVKLANTTFETLHMIVIAEIQGVLLAIGWRILIIKPERIQEKKCVCTEPVSAVLVDYKPTGFIGAIASSQSETSYTKYAIYVFEWEGEERKATAAFPYKGVVRRNFPSLILVNPHNPDEIFEPEVERSLIAHYRVEGSMFIVWGFLSFFYLIGGAD